MWHDRTAWRDDRTSTRGVALAAAVATGGAGPVDATVAGGWVWAHTPSTRRAPGGSGSERGRSHPGGHGLCPTPLPPPWPVSPGVYARPERPPVYGVALVRRVWTTWDAPGPAGPAALGHHGPPAQCPVWAWARRSDARHRLRGRPASVRVEAGYPSHSAPDTDAGRWCGLVWGRLTDASPLSLDTPVRLLPEPPRRGPSAAGCRGGRLRPGGPRRRH